jgi:hypothetical protein
MKETDDEEMPNTEEKFRTKGMNQLWIESRIIGAWTRYIGREGLKDRNTED